MIDFECPWLHHSVNEKQIRQYDMIQDFVDHLQLHPHYRKSCSPWLLRGCLSARTRIMKLSSDKDQEMYHGFFYQVWHLLQFVGSSADRPPQSFLTCSSFGLCALQFQDQWSRILCCSPTYQRSYQRVGTDSKQTYSSVLISGKLLCATSCTYSVPIFWLVFREQPGARKIGLAQDR